MLPRLSCMMQRDAPYLAAVSAMPGAETLSAGDRVMLASPTGQPFPATVAKVEDGNVTFDMNHEMAGKALNFNIELLEVAE